MLGVVLICCLKYPRQPHPGARHHRYRCSLPGLTEFADRRRGGTGADPGKGYAVPARSASINLPSVYEYNSD